MQIKSTISCYYMLPERLKRRGFKCEQRCRASTAGVNGKHNGINTLETRQF